MARQKILIDCDPGHDDLVAILFAARHLDVVGVSTTHGNNTLAATTRNAAIALDLAGLDRTPLAQGCAAPLAQASIGVAVGHGASGLDGAALPAPRRTPIATHAVDFIIETARAHKGELILAAIGPLTNVASALMREPRLASWLREVSVMGGSASVGNATPVAEFNIACDVEAAARVFDSGAALRMVGLDVTRATGFDEADIARLRASGRRLAAIVADLVAFYLGTQRARYGAAVAPMHDVCAIVPYVYPDLIETVRTSVRIETAGALTRGMTVCDLRHPAGVAAAPHLAHRTPENCRLAVRAQSRALAEAVLDALVAYD